MLKGSSVREGKAPWGLKVSDLVHGVKVGSGFVFTLASREEHDSRNCRGNGSGENGNGLVCNLLSRDVFSVGISSTRGDHVWLQEDTFKVDMIVAQCLEDSSIDSLGSSKAGIDVMGTIAEDFRFDDGDKTIGLADSSVSSKAPSVFLDSNVRWLTISDLKDSSPFSESASEVVEFLSSLGKIIKTESSGFTLSSWNISGTSIELGNVR